MCLPFVWILFQVIVFTEVDAHNCRTHEYLKWMLDGSYVCIPCSVCPEGLQLKRPCSKFKDTVCSKYNNVNNFRNNKKIINRRRRCTVNCNYNKPKLKCEEGQYLSRKDKLCKNCTVCAPGYFVKRNCSASRDSVCRPCKTGYFSDSFNQQQCEKCSKCSKGFHINRKCSSKSDTTCSSCPPKHYTDQRNSLYYCLTCSFCGAGRETIRNCTATQNTVCGKCKIGYFHLHNSTECAECSECSENTNSTEVEECRKTSRDKSKICIPDIIIRHRELNKTAGRTLLTSAVAFQGNPADQKQDNNIVNNRHESPPSSSLSSASSPSYTPYIVMAAVLAFSVPIITFISYSFCRTGKPKSLEEINLTANEIQETNDYRMNRVNSWRQKFHTIYKCPSWSEPNRLNKLSSARSVCTDVPLKDFDTITLLASPQSEAPDSDLFSISRVELI